MKRTIANTDYQFNEADIPIEKLRFWTGNPRVYADIYSLYGENVTDLTKSQLQQKIYDELIGHKDVRKLRGQIENAGLVEPLIVRKNNRDDIYEVLEGNRRLAACRMILKKARDSKREDLINRFLSLSCEIVPENFPESHIFALLGTLHITGKLKWESFATASYIKRRFDSFIREGFSEDIALQSAGNEFGIKKPTVNKCIAIINLMKYAKEKERDKYSFYKVLVTNKVTRNDIKDSALKKRWIKSVQEYKGTAIEFRSAVGAIVKDSRALKKFRYGNLSLETAAQQAIDNGSTDTMYQRVHNFRISMASAKPHLKKMDVTDTAFQKLKFEFKRLKTLSNEIFNILERKNG